MATLQRFEQFLAAKAQITQAVLRHEEKFPQGRPSMALAMKAAQAGGKGVNDLRKGGPGRMVGGDIDEDHFGFLQRR